MGRIASLVLAWSNGRWGLEFRGILFALEVLCLPLHFNRLTVVEARARNRQLTTSHNPGINLPSGRVIVSSVLCSVVYIKQYVRELANCDASPLCDDGGAAVVFTACGD